MSGCYEKNSPSSGYKEILVEHRLLGCANHVLLKAYFSFNDVSFYVAGSWCACVRLGSKEARRGFQIPRAGLTGGSRLLRVKAGNLTQGLGRSSTHT